MPWRRGGWHALAAPLQRLKPRTSTAKACKPRGNLTLRHAFAVLVRSATALHSIGESMPPGRREVCVFIVTGRKMLLLDVKVHVEVLLDLTDC
jgi:hypothetical protein